MSQTTGLIATPAVLVRYPLLRPISPALQQTVLRLDGDLLLKTTSSIETARWPQTGPFTRTLQLKHGQETLQGALAFSMVRHLV